MAENPLAIILCVLLFGFSGLVFALSEGVPFLRPICGVCVVIGIACLARIVGAV